MELNEVSQIKILMSKNLDTSLIISICHDEHVDTKCVVLAHPTIYICHF